VVERLCQDRVLKDTKCKNAPRHALNGLVHDKLNPCRLTSPPAVVESQTIAKGILPASNSPRFAAAQSRRICKHNRSQAAQLSRRKRSEQPLD
jgi:hypothetical protein